VWAFVRARIRSTGEGSCHCMHGVQVWDNPALVGMCVYVVTRLATRLRQTF